MKTVLMMMGRTADRMFQQGLEEYAGRICHYIPFVIEVIPELKSTKNLSENVQKEQEAELFRKRFCAGDYIVLLDEHGKERTSMEFSAWMQKRLASSPKRLVFLIGGPYGFAPSIHEAGAEEISLSRMTFSHQMIRLLFVEQIYRAMTILNGEPYHHE